MVCIRKQVTPLITAATRQSFPPRGSHVNKAINIAFSPGGSLENRRTLKFQTVCNSPLGGTRRALIHYYVFQGGVFGKRGTAQFFPVEAAFERFVAQLFRFEYHLRAVF